MIFNFSNIHFWLKVHKQKCICKFTKAKMEELANTLQCLCPTTGLLSKDYFKPSMLFRNSLGNEQSSLEFVVWVAKKKRCFEDAKKHSKVLSSANIHVCDTHLPPHLSLERVIRILCPSLQFIPLKGITECCLQVAKGNPFISSTGVGLTKEIKHKMSTVLKRQIIWHTNK